MTRAIIALSAAILLGTPLAAQTQRGLNLQANPSPSPFLPNAPPIILAPPASGPEYLPAPLPDRDASGPALPRAGNATQLSPTIFTRGRQYRGEGYSAGSSAQEEQERRALPGAGFNLRMPLQQK